MINTKELKKRLIDCDMNVTQLADAIGISRSSAYFKIKGERCMTLSEAERIQGILHISDEDFGLVFMSHTR